MKLIRFISDGKIYCGRLNTDGTGSPYSDKSPEQHFSKSLVFSDSTFKIDKLLAPVLPLDILGIGLNYRAHAEERHAEPTHIPLLFIKAGNVLNDPLSPIPAPVLSSKVDYEGELAVIIGKQAKNISRENALDYVLGYTCANDVSARDWQDDKKLGGGQFSRGKSFDGFCPLGPWIVTKDEIPDPHALRLRTILNGQVMQDQSTGDMIHYIPALIESLSSTMTLRPGAVILTGTPMGVGAARNPPVWLKAGDVVQIEIEKIGTLENPVSIG